MTGHGETEEYMGAQSFKMADVCFVSAVQLSLEPSAQHGETVDGDLCLKSRPSPYEVMEPGVDYE